MQNFCLRHLHSSLHQILHFPNIAKPFRHSHCFPEMSKYAATKENYLLWPEETACIHIEMWWEHKNFSSSTAQNGDVLVFST